MAVHAPVAKGQKEVIGAWGYPDERQSWTWEKDTEGESLSVNVYSNHECVKLFLDGKQIDPAGSWTPDPDDAKCAITNRQTRFTTTYSVPYAPGVLTAKSYIGGVEMGNSTFITAKKASKLRLVADRTTIDASRSDLSYVIAEVVDADGVLVTCADEHKGSSCTPPVVSFTVSGAGELAAVGSGDPIDPSSFNGPARKTYRGRATAIVRPGKLAAISDAMPPAAGSIIVKAKADGLGEASIIITTTVP
eukprot:COSAG02_NODE_652_length_18867_cov_30.656756_5_plen_248_part_00